MVVIFACRVSSLSVCVHMSWGLLDLVHFAILIFLMYTHSSHFFWDVFHDHDFCGSYVAMGCLCEVECFGSLLLMCALHMSCVHP